MFHINVFFQSYEARIDALQKQVEEQSMTMSMYSSSYTNTEENMNTEEDVYGECLCKYLIRDVIF